jgi:hypothetical protein
MGSDNMHTRMECNLQKLSSNIFPGRIFRRYTVHVNIMYVQRVGSTGIPPSPNIIYSLEFLKWIGATFNQDILTYPIATYK